MPRFTEDEMKNAVLKVTEEGLSVNRVAKENGLCKKTLKSYVDKYLSNFGDNGTGIRFRPNYEINQVFTNEHEQIFEEYLTSLDCTQSKITRDLVRTEAYNFATMCNVHVPKTWNVRKQAGLDWMYSYLNRHPNIKSIIVRNKKLVNQPFQSIDHNATETCIISIEDIQIENHDYSSDDELEAEETENGPTDQFVETNNDFMSSSTNGEYLPKIRVKTPFDEFCENISSAYGRVAEEGFVDAEQVYNLGEIALIVDDSLSKSGRQILVTACCFINAAGNHLPPFFVFPRKEFCSSMLEGLPEGSAGMARPDGRLDNNAFSFVLEHFRNLVRVTTANKVVLIMDVDEHHITINSLDFCQKHDIELVTLPPHYGANLQPAEKCIFPTIRVLFNQCLDQLRANEHSYLTPQRVAMLFCRIQKIAFTADNISKGFSENGIFPLDDSLLNSDVFLSRKTEHYEPTMNVTEISLDFSDIPDENDTLSDEAGTSAPIEIKPSISAQCFLPEKNVSFDGTPLEEFFRNLAQAYNELRTDGNMIAASIYNVDELEMLISSVNSDTSQRCISMCCYANALGHMLPPFLVYPEDEYSPAMLDSGIAGTRGTTSVDGRIDNAIFIQMLQHLQQCVGSGPSNRIVVIMDCEEYHISLRTIEFCESNGIILVTVPPYVTELFQPLECTVFRTLFLNLNAQFMEVDPEKGLSMFDVAGILGKTFESCLTAESIASGFKSSGLWPLNHDLIVLSTAWLTYAEKSGVNDRIVAKMVSENSNMDENEDSDSGHYYQLSVSNSDVLLFYDKIEAFLEEFSSDDRLYVLGDLRLNTRNVVTNVMLFVNAVGTLLPPYVIYSSDDYDIVLKSSLGITCYRCERSLVDQHTLLKSMMHFREHSRVSNDCRMLLLLKDADSSRLTPTVREFGEQNGIVFVKFPSSHAEHLHPMESSFIEMLKHRFEETRSRLESINDVISFLEQAFIELFVPEEIVTKFREHKMTTESILTRKREDEITVTDHEIKIDLSTCSEGKLKEYDDLIFEEEIEISVDEEEISEPE